MRRFQGCVSATVVEWAMIPLVCPPADTYGANLVTIYNRLAAKVGVAGVCCCLRLSLVNPLRVGVFLCDHVAVCMRACVSSLSHTFICVCVAACLLWRTWTPPEPQCPFSFPAHSRAW